MGVGGAVLADRTEEYPCEFAESSAADNQHGRVFRCLAEDRTRISLYHSARHRQTRPLGLNLHQRLLEDVLRVTLRVESGEDGVYQPGLLYQSQTTTTSIFSPVKDAQRAAHLKALIEVGEPSTPTTILSTSRSVSAL